MAVVNAYETIATSGASLVCSSPIREHDYLFTTTTPLDFAVLDS